MVKGKLFGQGRTAEVFEYGDNKILKLFQVWMPEHAIQREYENACKAQECGLPEGEKKQLEEVVDTRIRELKNKR